MLESLTWQAALAVSVDPAVIAAMSEQQFLARGARAAYVTGRQEALAPDRPRGPCGRR